MKSYRALLVMLVATGAIWACNKEDTDDDPATPPDNTVFDALFADNVADAQQVFELDAVVGRQIICAQGTRLHFQPGAFRHSDSTPVTGQVDVTVVEALTVGDMIWLNKQTVGNDNGTLRMLRSGGAINVTASQDGSPLLIAPGGLYVQIPTTVGDPAMQLFGGSEDADGRMIWNPIDSSVVTVEPVYIDLFYSFPADSMYWINCDYFYSYPSTTMLEATIPPEQSTDSTQVWIAFPSENAVMQMYHSIGQTYTTWQVVPVGMQAVVVGLRMSTSGQYSSFTPVTISENMTVPMTFAPTTLEEFEAAVNAL